MSDAGCIDRVAGNSGILENDESVEQKRDPSRQCGDLKGYACFRNLATSFAAVVEGIVYHGRVD